MEVGLTLEAVVEIALVEVELVKASKLLMMQMDFVVSLIIIVGLTVPVAIKEKTAVPKRQDTKMKQP